MKVIDSFFVVSFQVAIQITLRRSQKETINPTATIKSCKRSWSRRLTERATTYPPIIGPTAIKTAGDYANYQYILQDPEARRW